ncbi:hypothetical protein [Pseudonocardia sp. TMWB2A]|uniref:hypothetical protein n=1 Tax=Pseudonocardia sp. TMWB2A TaxID=687430 RepID=UPI00307EE2A3
MSLLSYTGGQQLVMLPDSLNGDENQERTHLFCALFSGQGDPVADRANACPPPFISGKLAAKALTLFAR